MGLLDAIIIIVVLGAAFVGFKKGVISQLGGIAGIILGVVACRLFADELAITIEDLISDDANKTVSKGSIVLAYTIIFIAVYLLSQILAKFLHSIVKAVKLGWLNRLAGTVFAVIQWTFLLSIALNVVQVLLPDKPLASKSSLGDGALIVAVMDFAPNLMGTEEVQDVTDKLFGSTDNK